MRNLLCSVYAEKQEVYMPLNNWTPVPAKKSGVIIEVVRCYCHSSVQPHLCTTTFFCHFFFNAESYFFLLKLIIKKQTFLLLNFKGFPV